MTVIMIIVLLVASLIFLIFENRFQNKLINIDEKLIKEQREYINVLKEYIEQLEKEVKNV